MEFQRGRIIKDIDDATYDAIQQMLKISEIKDLIGIGVAGERRLAKVVKFFRITCIATTPGCVFTLRDILQYEKGGDNYGSFYDQVRTYLNTLHDADVVDRQIGTNGEYIYSAKGTDPSAVMEKLQALEKRAEWFKKVMADCSKVDPDTGKAKLVKCPLPLGKGKICGAKVTKTFFKQGSTTLIISQCMSGHTCLSDTEEDVFKKINQRKSRSTKDNFE